MLQTTLLRQLYPEALLEESRISMRKYQHREPEMDSRKKGSHSLTFYDLGSISVVQDQTKRNITVHYTQQSSAQMCGVGHVTGIIDTSRYRHSFKGRESAQRAVPTERQAGRTAQYL